MVQSRKGKLPGQSPGAAWSHLALTATHGITARCLHHGSIVIPQRRAEGQEIQGWEHRPHPAPSWWPEFSLAFGARLVQTRFPGRCWGKRCQLYLPGHFPLPQICGTSLFSHHVTALYHSGSCTQTGQILFKCPWEKDAARSDLHIYSDHYSLLRLARRGFLPLPQLPMQCW